MNPRKPIVSENAHMYNDEVHLIQDNNLANEAYLAMLHEIEDKTTDGDHRCIARNYIVQLSLRKANKEDCEQFIEEAIQHIINVESLSA